MSDYSLTVFGVQPFLFDSFERDMSLVPASSAGSEQLPESLPAWTAELERLYPGGQFVYRNLEDSAPLECDGLCLNLSAWLCSNTVLNQHLVLLELHADAIDVGVVDMGRLRSLLVMTTADDKRPGAVQSTVGRAREAAARVAGCKGEDIVVLCDTCNVTVILSPNGSEGRSIELDALAFSHDNAERLTVDRALLRVSDSTRVFFGSRVHVVISSSQGDIGVIKRIMFMLQVMWFYVPLYLRHASVLHREILGSQPRRDLSELEGVAARLVCMYQTVRLQNESAKISYEALSSLVYEPAESLWTVERTIDQFQRYADFFQSFIKDVREVRSRKADEILGYVLAALGLFGFVGLWANILAAETSVHEIVSFRNLMHIAFTTPLGFTTIVFIAISVTVAAWLVAYGIRARHGGERKLPKARLDGERKGVSR